jgi:hypothetical protein
VSVPIGEPLDPGEGICAFGERGRGEIAALMA